MPKRLRFFSFKLSTWVFSTDVVVVVVVLCRMLSTKECFIADEAKCWPSLGCFARCIRSGGLLRVV